jgi:lysophospholipase L1-like esterase
MTLRYLALGDSYSIGEGVPESGRWPVQLAQALRAEGIALTDPQIIATTGWTTDELDAGIDVAAPQGPFALVTLLIGVNNQYRGRPLDEYRSQFAALLERAIGLADGHAGRVLVLSIPDWGTTPFAQAQGRDTAAIGHEIDAFNAVAADVCADRGVGFVDITPYSRAHGHEVEMLVDDTLHPSATMYAGWTALTLPEARRVFL